MPRWFACVVVGGLLWGTPRAATAEEAFPYTARIERAEAQVRSGPGEQYYTTQELKRGDEVEVYRHDPGGWCAIRPPEGSFSWVSGEFVARDDHDLGVVQGDQVLVRVGSLFGDIRDVIQVRLDRGERVEILEMKPFRVGNQVQAWYRIAPPAGEFRWVHQDDLLAEGTAPPREADPPAPATSVDEPAPRAEPAPSRGASAPASETAAADEDLPAPRVAVSGPVDFRAQIDEIDLELAQIAARSPDRWDLNRVRAKAEAALARAETAVDRGYARQILSRIERFESIHERYLTVVEARKATDLVDRPRRDSGTDVTVRAGPRSATDTAAGRFDGRGKLTQVVAPKPGAPQYALVDETGTITCYVTPAPGVNLRSYLGTEVGILGTRGYLTEQAAMHVTARQIAPLSATAAGTLLR